MSLTTAELTTIILGSGGVSALATKLIELASAGSVRRATAAGERRVQALTLAEHLENYAYGCAGHLYGTYDAVEHGKIGTVMRQLPAFPPFSDKIAWHAIDPELAERARSFRNRVEVAKGAIEASYDVSLAQGRFYAFLQAADIGIDACDVAAALRAAAKLRPIDLERRYSWDFARFLRGEKAKEKQRYEQIFALAA